MQKRPGVLARSAALLIALSAGKEVRPLEYGIFKSYFSGMKESSIEALFDVRKAGGEFGHIFNSDYGSGFVRALNSRVINVVKGCDTEIGRAHV